MSKVGWRPIDVAARNPIAFEGPAVDFFEGAVLGNGAMGAIVTTRPDAVVVHFGHNDVWDIRMQPIDEAVVGTFQEVFERVRALRDDLRRLEDDPEHREYLYRVKASYNKPYPRPFPCGSVILGFDARVHEVLGHTVDIATGVCRIDMLTDGERIQVELFCEPDADRLWIRTVDTNGAPCPAPFNRLRLLPDTKTPTEFPPHRVPEGLPTFVRSFEQTLPSLEPERYDPATGHPNDRAFRLSAVVSTDLERRTRLVNHLEYLQMGALEGVVLPGDSFYACVELESGLASDLAEQEVRVPRPTEAMWEQAAQKRNGAWADFWSRSGVRLSDAFLERIWYWNLYFLNCAVKPGVTCPGLYANWSLGDIGTSWHGDYHGDYNMQQPFWVTFSSNHVDKHMPYVDLIDHLRPVARKKATEYYGLRGACYPISSYPVHMESDPYPLPNWGWMISTTPWIVQSLWWHYLYTQDKAFLRERAYEPLREAVEFVVAYMLRPEAHGPQWGDDRYHVFPTVPPELYSLRPGFQFNSDCILDLTLIRFLFNAFQQASEILGRQGADAELLDNVREILAHFPEDPTAETPDGTVFVSVAGEDPDVVYNCPVSLAPVFPGEEIGLHSPPDVYEQAVRTYRVHRNEGGNELVFLNLIAARLGRLDLERFKRQIRYCMMPNGTCTDKVLQVDGRYHDTTPFDYMARMGIWFENFALPLVVNECMLQSYTGTLRFFPNWPQENETEFYQLRAVGAFLVSARFARGRVEWIEIESEAGAPLRLYNPWAGSVRCERMSGVPGASSDGASEETTLVGEVLEVPTHAGERLRFSPIA